MELKEIIFGSCSIVFFLVLMLFFPRFTQGKFAFEWIDVEYFKPIKLRKSAWLFRGIGYKDGPYYDVKKYGIIRPMLASQIIGYLWTILSVVLTFVLVFATDLPISNIVMIIASCMGCEAAFGVIIVMVSGLVGRMRKAKNDHFPHNSDP